ncbi:glycosyltransferase [Escherichia coli]|nr:glycosyltransferase [Escherichia coli]EMC6816838.1 glycosyltransferase [Escherichia coli]HDS0050574.1 glycosyltransferase [Escherichia coli]HDS0540757.1 glycosyltransferase [Escherichia coli]
MIKFSVVTVVFNAAEAFSKTINSVKKQTYSNVEYIVIDGGSTDGTLSLIKENINFISRFVSEEDKGIYDAMNKAINLASGDWIIFINAGDVFYDERILEKTASFIRLNKNKQPDLIGGEVMYDVSGKYEKGEVKSLSKRWVCMPSCHQSLFIRVSTHKNYLYNIDYTICADHELVIRLLNEGCTFLPYRKIISVFSWDGVSARNRISLYKEKLQIALKYNAPLLDIFKLRLLILRVKLSGFLRSIKIKLSKLL